MQRVNQQIDKLTDLLINKSITKDVYDRKFGELQKTRKGISVKQEEHQEGNEEFKTALTNMLTLASRAPEIFKSSKIALKRSLMALVFSNLRLSGGKLQYDLHRSLKRFPKRSVASLNNLK